LTDGLGSIAATVAALAVVAACTSSASNERPSPTTASVSGAGSPTPAVTERELRQDLRALVAHIRSTHPDPWHSISRLAFDGAVSALNDRLRELGRDAFLVELMRLMALLGPRDGHSGVFPTEQQGHLLPFRLYRFGEGVFVVDASDDHTDLIGAEVTRIAGWPISDLWSAVAPLVPADNEMTRLARVPHYLVVAEILHGLGITDDTAAPMPLAFDLGDGPTTVEIEPIPTSTYTTTFDVWNALIPPALPPRPDGAVSFEHAGEFRWFERIGDAAYVGYHVTLGETDDLARQVINAVTDGADRVVLDLRFNPGGNHDTYAALLEALRDPRVDRPGRLLVLIGRSTFSAAGNLATELDVSTSAVFIGEESGFAPDQFGDPSTTALPNTGIRADVATVFWRFDRGPGDRMSIEPDLPVTISSEDYFAGRDPVLEAALSYRPG
jgi:hypothetical protein